MIGFKKKTVTTLALVLGVLLGAHANKVTGNRQDTTQILLNSNNSPTITLPDFTVAAEKAIHAVVHIKSVGQVQRGGYGGFNDPFFDFFFGDGGQYYTPQPQVSMGSGVIISTDGYIVTNNHVIDRAKEIEVTLNDKRSFIATLVGVDPVTDLALLKIETNNLPTITWGNSDNLKVGEWVLAVGNPFNLTSTVTAGIVSAKARNINILQGSDGMKIESFIQTDAAVNPGNSGGALVSTSGDLVGINTAIASQTGNYTGYSFAVPVSIVSKVVEDLKQFGSVQRAILGVSILDITSQLAKEKDLKVLEGVYVAAVNEKSSAMEAGIIKGDVITGINGVKVKSVSELQEQVGRYSPGNTISITLQQSGDLKTVNLTLKNRQGSTTALPKKGVEILGAEFKLPSNDLMKNLGITYGVQIDKLNEGKFRTAGLKSGLVILKINDAKIRSVDDITQITQELLRTEEQAMFIIGVYPNKKMAYYAINLSE